MAEPCRCGFDGVGDVHPCHGLAYTCKKPATRRFIAQPLGTYSLAGMQPKFAASDTWACDECWAKFQEMQKVAKA